MNILEFVTQQVLYKYGDRSPDAYGMLRHIPICAGLDYCALRGANAFDSRQYTSSTLAAADSDSHRVFP